MTHLWFEYYGCGCVSDYVRLKRDLVGYCGQHGDSRTQVFKVEETKVTTKKE